ncbi:transcription factor 23-like [Dendropsophus ebraccatus]|uniref:transcription factor 23-like n=1 Tax=Dendropsophus ebraccatus TaxID=150705 RepID=UPI003831A77B
MERMEPEVVLSGWQVPAPGLLTSMAGGEKDEALPGGHRTTTWRKSRQRVTTKPTVTQVATSSRPIQGKHSPENNVRERNRVRTLREAFLSLQAALPSVPPDTKLSKLDVLVLATSYIAHLTQTLDQERPPPTNSQTGRGPGYLHPMKKWPMRSRLYAEAPECEVSHRSAAHQDSRDRNAAC